ncbi:MAG TPA: hypothetical protein VKA67_13995, partial [Verrucomicrobiae bacterium]|nr:hypothetical protein [Verrucomicrobiae bacterium]
MSAFIALTGMAWGQTAENSPLQGVVTLMDAHRKLIVIQNSEPARAIKVVGDMPRVQFGERISVEGSFAPYFGVFPNYPAHPSGHWILPAFKG